MRKEENERIYLDYMSSTPVRAEVLSLMGPYHDKVFGHPWSLHSFGKESAEAIRSARSEVAQVLDAGPGEVIFTSGATEANTQAIKGAVEAHKRIYGSVAGKRVVLSAIEHDSIRSARTWLEGEGIEVVLLRVDEDGVVDLKHAREVITKDTILVSVMYVNSEIGTIQPLKEIAKIIARVREKNDYPLFHTDASQATRFLPVVPRALGVDLMTLDGHKMYGPKGVGILYVKRGIELEPLFFDEKRRTGELRRGTPPTPLIVGCAKALLLANAKREEYVEDMKGLFVYTKEKLLSEFPDARINGSGNLEKRIPGNINITFPGANHEFLQVGLDERGIALATASACQSGEQESYVLQALNTDSTSALRISFGKGTTREHVDRLIAALKDLLPLA